MRVVLTTPPASEPVTLTEAKAHLRVTHTQDDTYITSLISAARQIAERRTSRSFIARTYTLTLDRREAQNPIHLPHGPVASVTSFAYFDAAGSAQAVSSGAYYLDGDRVVASPSASAADWPVYERIAGAARVVYVAGDAADAADVPDDVKQAILIIIADLYEKRETQIGAGLVLTEVPYSAARILDLHTNYTFG